MLSAADNETLTRVGPGTPMGRLLRRFWMPAMMEEEVAAPDCDPVRLRLLGEDLLAFRDTQGRLAIVDAHCPHRLAHLYFGRNEQGGIRCVYHGWKFDVAGNCVDMPTEPPESKHAHRVKLRSYPTAVRAGVVWIYMGPPEHQPELPQFEWSLLPAARRVSNKRLQECNWAQAVEGGIDSAHVGFLHSGSPLLSGKTGALLHADRMPKFEVEEVEHGLMIGARRDAGDEQYYWRVSQFLLPFYTMIPPDVGTGKDSSQAFYSGHAWVPIDDENTWTWSFAASPHRDLSPEEAAWNSGIGDDRYIGAFDKQYRPLLNKANDYGLDRALQRSGHFTGIQPLGIQDSAVQESMGPVVDRTREHLGHTDRAIVKFRRLLISLARELASEGTVPVAANKGALYRVRSASLILPRDVKFQEAVQSIIAATDTTPI